jgi:ATP-dependent DNA ligase
VTCCGSPISFDDGEELLRAAARFGLESIVSKKRKASYVAGPCGWLKVKTQRGGMRAGQPQLSLVLRTMRTLRVMIHGDLP